jgi:sorbitol-specific phosphotransferase system component IIBC
MKKPHVVRYMRVERQTALETFVVGSPAALAKVRDESENGMAVVAAVKAGELLQQGALESEASVQKRAPGLQIVVIESNGSQRVAFQPEQRIPMLDVTVPAPEPALQRDADLE